MMPDTDDVACWYALYRFTVSYWFEVVFNGGDSAHEFYLPGALFAVGNNRFEGQEKIRAFYAKRRQRGPLTARHLVNNLQGYCHCRASSTAYRRAQPLLRPRPCTTSGHTSADVGRRHRG